MDTAKNRTLKHQRVRHPQTIKESLGLPASGFRGVYCLWGDIEGDKYAYQLREAFKGASWDVGKMVGQVGLDSVPEGLLVAISPDDKQSPPERALRIYKALWDAGLHPQGLLINSLKSGEFYVLVGANPKPDSH